jgi:hypothetical protein
MGFLKAMKLRWNDWDPLRNTNRIESLSGYIPRSLLRGSFISNYFLIN